MHKDVLKQNLRNQFSWMHVFNSYLFFMKEMKTQLYVWNAFFVLFLETHIKDNLKTNEIVVN